MRLVEESLQISIAGAVLEADVVVPEHARGVVVFAHGSGSSRHSPRNRYVAAELQHAGLATVLADLLTPAEEERDAHTAELRFDIGLLATRVAALTDWVAADERTTGLGTGLFGASTGAAAALVAAAERPETVQAVVSRGGRPDLAGWYLPRVHQPTLLIVGGADTVVIELNRQAMRQLAGQARLEIVPGASHLFEGPGTLEQVARLARDWFLPHLRPIAHRAGQGPDDQEPGRAGPSGCMSHWVVPDVDQRVVSGRRRARSSGSGTEASSDPRQSPDVRRGAAETPPLPSPRNRLAAKPTRLLMCGPGRAAHADTHGVSRPTGQCSGRRGAESGCAAASAR